MKKTLPALALCLALCLTPAQFNTDFYNGIVHVVTGQRYVSNGTELTAPFSVAAP